MRSSSGPGSDAKGKILPVESRMGSRFRQRPQPTADLNRLKNRNLIGNNGGNEGAEPG